MKRQILPRLACCILVTIASFLAACATTPSDPGDPNQGGGGNGGAPAALCAERVNGALVTFDIAGQTFSVWIENGAFIDEAKMLLAAGQQKVPVFNQVIDGRDCDSDWTYHVDPNDVGFADVTIELCDGTPQYIEDNKAEWISTVKQYCPWSAKVTAVDDRR
ncbi:MAG TPA: hypothetical protein PK156_42035 [Polyangium sp.]|nr:hypothetical protein [Polyangium sp.]